MSGPDIFMGIKIVTTKPEGIGDVVFGGGAPKNHIPAHTCLGKLSSY